MLLFVILILLLKEMVLMGLNTPIRIGKAIVLPGDLVLSEREGVLFIPAHMAEQVILTAEFIGRKDKFGKRNAEVGALQYRTN